MEAQAKANPNSRILFLQAFFGHGYTKANRQGVATNRFDDLNNFYDLLPVEISLRAFAE